MNLDHTTIITPPTTMEGRRTPPGVEPGQGRESSAENRTASVHPHELYHNQGEGENIIKSGVIRNLPLILKSDKGSFLNLEK